MSLEERAFNILKHTKVEYPYEDVINMMRMFVETGNYKQSCEANNIKLPTGMNWKKEPWWTQLMDLTRHELQKEMDHRMTGMLNQTLDAIQDRLRNGDYNANGKLVPVSTTNLAKIFTTLYDKRALIRGEPTSRVEKVSTEQRLKKLANRFQEIPKLAKKQTLDLIEDIDEEIH